MKGKWVKFLSALACLTLAVGFASCGGNDDSGDGAQECTHSFTDYVSDNNATCTEDGTKTAKCDNGCGATDTVTDEGSATGHNWANGTCTSCGEEKGYSEGLKYKLNEDGESYSLVGMGTCKDTDLVIPSTYDDLPVVSIADHAFYFSRFLTSVVIPDGVTTIGNSAFSGCDSLMSITIPDSVTTMAGGAFYNCGVLIIYCEAESESSGWNSNWNYSSCPVVWDCNNNDVASDGYIYTVINGIRYALKDGQATLIRQRRDIVIADIAKKLTYKGIEYSVTTIGEGAFYYCYGLTEIVIPNSVITIGSYAFYQCANLTSVDIGNGVTLIGDFAFDDCDNLTSVKIGDSVESIGEDAFAYCRRLTNITVDKNNTSYKGIDGNLYTRDGKTLLQYAIGKSATTFTIPDGVTTIGDGAFAYCDSLTEIVIPDSVTTIGGSAFADCNRLTEIVIPDSVTTIGNSAFKYCGGLTRIKIPNDITMISDSAFSNCANLTSVEFGNSVTTIGNSAFSGCYSLMEIVIPDGVTTIGNGAFSGCYSLMEIVIPDSVTMLGASVFHYCECLTIYCEAEGDSDGLDGWDSNWIDHNWNDYYFPLVWDCNNNDVAEDGYMYTVVNGIRYGIKDGFAAVVKQAKNIITADIAESITYKEMEYNVTAIDYSAFYDCDDLTSVKIGDNVTTIGYAAFQDCISLTGVVIGNGVTSIGDYAFDHCWSLTEIVMPSGVTNIGEGAFAYCNSLTKIIIPDSVIMIRDYAFVDCECLIIYCEAESQPSRWESYWNGFACPVVWDCNNNDVANDGYIYVVIDGIRYALKDGQATVVKQAENIITAEIAETIAYRGMEYNVTAIDNEAFAGCDSLTSVVIGNGVTSISDYAFWRCSSLTSVEIPNGVTYIGMYAFADCDSLTKIVIPDSVIMMGSSAFSSCSSLTSVVIGNSVAIDGSVFSGCYSLTSITVDKNNAGLKDIDGNLYTKDGGTLIQYAIGKTATTFTIPDGVTTIGDGAFAYCDSLTEIVIPDSVATIGGSAFAGCDSLTEIIIPDSVTTIGGYAFEYCWSLTSVTFEDTSTWYVDEQEIDVTDPFANATYLVDEYYDHYWYKL